MQRSTTSLFGALGILVIGVLLVWYFLSTQSSLPSTTNTNTSTTTVAVNSFEECATNYAVQESYPPRCVGPDGRTFTQDIGNELTKRDLIQIDTPRPTAKVSSPLQINGKARGTWYFEASFPVELLDANGNRIASGPAQAQGDWMTEDFVPFKITLTFAPQPMGSHGTLVLHKDNPSGESFRDDSLIVPIVF